MFTQPKAETMEPDGPAPPAFPRASLAAAPTGRVLSRTLVLFRWIAVFGQTTTILVVAFVLRYDFSLTLTLAAVGASALLNVYLTLRYPASKRLSDNEAALYLAYDTLQLATLLFLTGGLHNPFSFLMLGPAMISATVLSKRSTILLVGMLLVCVSALVFFHQPLPWPGGKHPISHIYVFGIWSALVVGMMFFSINVIRVAEEGRRMFNALTETQMVLAREQRLSAVGGLAAAAAHELGTPLGTIALVAKEMSRELPEDFPFADDLKLLVSQSERCRDILARLTLRSEDGTDLSLHRLPFATLVEMAVDTARRDHPHKTIEVTVEHTPGPAEEPAREPGRKGASVVRQPIVPHSFEIIHGLGNLIENAMDFARARVSVAVGWSEREITVEIADDGPGFARGIIGALGEPYVSTRRDTGGMGLGVFIAKALLERTGAAVHFGNRKGGGARIVVAWPRALLVDPPRIAEPPPPPTDARQ